MRWLLLLLLALGPALPACAGDVTASEPSDISVTIYRNPGRNGGNLELASLGGFAVVTETRTISIPAGRSRIRFVGVVDGIITESAIVTAAGSSKKPRCGAAFTQRTDACRSRKKDRAQPDQP